MTKVMWCAGRISVSLPEQAQQGGDQQRHCKGNRRRPCLCQRSRDPEKQSKPYKTAGRHAATAHWVEIG